ncbi:MAG: protein kinase [Ilumatobacteraceae bacterium]
MSDERRDPGLAPGEPRSFGNGRYVVRRRLGAGNFATVYEAYDERLDVPVAVKLLSDRWSWEPEVRGRFVQEARLLRSLNDSRVVQIRDIAETEDGRPYLVMDFATRGTLEQRLVELAQRGVRPDVRQLRAVVSAMAAALGVLHERRIAHRDIKPSNILITTKGSKISSTAASDEPALLRPDEVLMLGDLGLAKDLSFDSGVTVGVGTAGYMAPEQALAGAKVDTRTDIYAASALLAQIASGEPPDPLRRISNGSLQSGRPLPPTIPDALGRALGHGLDADPNLRTQTIEQWQAEVDSALAQLDPATRAPLPGTSSSVPVSSPGSLPPPVSNPGQPVSSPGQPEMTDAQRYRRAGAIAAAILAVVGGIALVLVTRGGDDPGSAGDDTDASVTSPESTASASTEPATTAEPTTIPLVLPTTARPTVPTTAELPSVPVAVTLNGPTRISVNEETLWTVTQSNAVSGRWSTSPPMQLTSDEWTPDSQGFRGTWTEPIRITITLTVQDALGNEASDSITVDVVA